MRRFVPVVLGLTVLGLTAPRAYAQAGPIVTILPTSQTATAGEGATAVAIKFRAVTNSSQPSYPDVQFDHSKLVQVGDLSTPTPGSYRAAFNTVADLPGGTTTGTVIFRLCSDTPCTQEIAGTARTFTYTINVTLKDWITFQRDAGHSGYVHTSYTGAPFKHAWVWQPAGTYDGYAKMSAVATRGSAVFLVQESVQAEADIVSLVHGAPQWSYPLTGRNGDVLTFGAPSVAGDKVVTAWQSNGSGSLYPIAVLNAGTGAVAVPNLTFSQQQGILPPLTPQGDNVYMASGNFGNVVYNYDLAAGQQVWTVNGLGGQVWQGEALAADSQYVYYDSGPYLDVFDRITGTRVRSVPDPLNPSNLIRYLGGPILGSGGNVIAYSGDSYYRRLVKFPATGTASIVGANAGYRTAPAIAHGIIYAAGSTGLDAISEADGSVLWTWAIPNYDGSVFNYNIIATDNLVFVSTTYYLYAISITDPAHGVVWSAPTPGNIAISSDNLLLVTTMLYGEPALVAYTLK